MKDTIWSSPRAIAWRMPISISGPMNMPLPTAAKNWLKAKSIGRSMLVRCWSRKAAVPSRMIEVSSCGISAFGPKVSAPAAMPTSTPTRITPNRGAICSGPMPSVRIMVIIP